jgi:hypothetical protein
MVHRRSHAPQKEKEPERANAPALADAEGILIGTERLKE